MDSTNKISHSYHYFQVCFTWTRSSWLVFMCSINCWFYLQEIKGKKFSAWDIHLFLKELLYKKTLMLSGLLEFPEADLSLLIIHEAQYISMPQKEISQDRLCPLYSSKQEWLRYKRAYCSETFLWVRTVRAEKIHIKLTPSASHEDVSKQRSIMGKGITGKYREQAHVQKNHLYNRAGYWKNTGWSRKKNPFFMWWHNWLQRWGQLTSMGSLLPTSLNPKSLLQNNLSNIFSPETQFHTTKPQQFNVQGL